MKLNFLSATRAAQARQRAAEAGPKKPGWLERFFDASTPQVAAARTEIAALSAVDIEPPRPAVGAAGRLLARVMRGGAPAP